MTEIRRRYQLPVCVTRAFEAWITLPVSPVTRVEVEPRIGGRFRLTVAGEAQASVMDGCIVAIEPNQRLQYSWRWQGDPTVSAVDVRFHPACDATRIELLHRGLPSESRARHETGWDAYIDGLGKALA